MVVLCREQINPPSLIAVEVGIEKNA